MNEIIFVQNIAQTTKKIKNVMKISPKIMLRHRRRRRRRRKNPEREKRNKKNCIMYANAFVVEMTERKTNSIMKFIKAIFQSISK